MSFGKHFAGVSSAGFSMLSSIFSIRYLEWNLRSGPRLVVFFRRGVTVLDRSVVCKDRISTYSAPFLSNGLGTALLMCKMRI